MRKRERETQRRECRQNRGEERGRQNRGEERGRAEWRRGERKAE